MRDAKRTPGGSLRECRRRCEYVRPSNPPPPSTRQSSGPRSGQETIGAPTHSMRPSPTSANTSNQVTVRAGSRITTRLSTDPARQRTDRRLGALVGTLGQPRLIQGVRLAGSLPMPPGEARADFLRSVHAIVADGSTVVSELALRPGFSTQARMPPTARSASRGGRRGLLVLTAGPVSCSTGVTPPARWPRPNLRAGVLALFLARGSKRGMGRRGDDDADATGLGSTSARRVGPRSRVAAAFRGDRCPATPERAPTARYPHQGRPGRSERSSLRVPDANVRLAGGCRCGISSV